MSEETTGISALMKKDEIRTAVAVVICILIVMVYSQIVMEPYRREMEIRKLQALKEAKTSTATQVATSAASPAATLSSPPAQVSQEPAAPARVAHPTPAEINAHPITTIESDRTIVRISHLGGRLTAFQLKQHTASLGSDVPLDMVVIAENEALPLGVYSGGLSDEHVVYSLSGVTEGIEREGDRFLLGASSAAKELSLRFTGSLPNGAGITKTFRFLPNSYLFELNIELSQESTDGSKLWLEWTHHQSANAELQRLNPLIFTLLGANNKVTHIPAPEISAGLPEYGGNVWMSLGDKYFMGALVPSSEEGINTRLGHEDGLYLMRASGTPRAGKFMIYAGPKDHSELQSIGYQLDRNVDLGWFAFLAHPLLWLIKLFYKLLGNYGLSIILLTLLIKTLFLPLTQSSLESMKAMQAIQPEIKALRERIDDPTKLNQEMMALYKKRGVNPMGGCLPILIQLPVFLGLYNALLYSIELRHAPFALWINDLSAPESLQIWGIGVPVMILMMGASMLVQQWTTPTVGDPAQKKAMMMMPVIFTVMFILFPFPSGLVLYWLVNNLISIIQQTYLRGEGKAGPMAATLVGAVGIFGIGFVLTLL